MRENVEELPDVAAVLDRIGVSVWEVFLLVKTGRGVQMEELTPAENEDLCHFLYEASRYGFVVRTVEAPFFRRVVATRNANEPPDGVGALYRRLSGRLVELLGEPRFEPKAQTKGTRDGKGIVFVGHDGDVYPAGFLPLTVGNVRDLSLARSIATARSCARSVPGDSAAAAERAGTPTSAAAHGLARSPPPATLWRRSGVPVPRRPS